MKFQVLKRGDAVPHGGLEKAFTCEVTISLLKDEREGLEIYCSDRSLSSRQLMPIESASKHSDGEAVKHMTYRDFLARIAANDNTYHEEIVAESLWQRESRIHVLRKATKQVKTAVCEGFTLINLAKLGDLVEEY